MPSTVTSHDPSHVFGTKHDTCILSDTKSTHEGVALSIKLRDEYGFRNLPVDGIWTRCHIRAIEMATGTSEYFSKYRALGLTCKSLNVQVHRPNDPCDHPEWLEKGSLEPLPPRDDDVDVPAEVPPVDDGMSALSIVALLAAGFGVIYAGTKIFKK